MRASTLLSSLGLLLLAASPVGAATESSFAPPEPLPFPAAASPSAGSVSVDFLRRLFEEQANVQLCRILLAIDKQPIPAGFDWAKCPTGYQQKVVSRQGKVKWAAGAKPTECGSTCFRRPSAGRETFRDRPNARHASFTGYLEFEVDIPGPNRTVRFPWETFFRCKVPAGKRDGATAIEVAFGQPLVGEPGFFEGALDFFLMPLDWSRRVDQAFRAGLATPGGVSLPIGTACSSVGAVAPPSAPAKFDAFTFDPPRPLATSPRLVAAAAATGGPRTATLHITRVTRPAPSPRFTPPADLGQIVLYLNGVSAPLPSVTLPPTGGSSAVHFCKTVNLEGWDSLQVIASASTGSAGWSQFSAAESFGAGGGGRTLVAGRTVPVPPLVASPGAKPESLVVRELELGYYVEASGAAPTQLQAAPAPAPVKRGRPLPRIAGNLTPALPCKWF